MSDDVTAAVGGAEPAALDGQLTIINAAALCERLRGWLDAGVTAIDLSGVDECDTAGIQLLLAAAGQARSHCAELKLHGASAALREVLGRYGLQGLVASHARPTAPENAP